MKSKNRYLMLTVDTEAIPCRAKDNHIDRLMWGKHENGTAGLRELCAIGNEFNAKHIFFIDFCASFLELDKTKEVALWLDSDGQDVQLHTHPEYLPPNFFDNCPIKQSEKLMNFYKEEKSFFVLNYFSKLLENLLKKPVLAHRAGSFRWNSGTLNALKKCNIPLSFNNSYAHMLQTKNPYSAKTINPFYWDNGLIEIPSTEKELFPFYKKDLWSVLQFPESKYFKYRSRFTSFIPYSIDKTASFATYLIHSWSLLKRNNEGRFYYEDARPQEDYRKLLKKLSKDFDIITSYDFLDLVKIGKIEIRHTEEVSKTVYVKNRQNTINKKSFFARKGK